MCWSKMLGVNLRFRPRTYRPRSAIKTALLVALVCAGIAGSGIQAQSAEPVKGSFLALSDGERFWFMEGAVRTVSHLIALTDKKKGDCAANWYLGDRANKRKLIEKAIAEKPDLGETTIIILQIEQACGPLTPAKALTTR